MKIDLRGKTEVNSALRSLVGCKDGDYIRYCIWTPVTNPNRERKRVVKRVFTAMNKVKPYMTDEELHRELSQFDESGFDDIPNWLQQELRARQLPIPKRFPTELEQWETVSDAREHRITNNELTLKDYKDKYLGKPLTVT
jgi:hypothetical protein